MSGSTPVSQRQKSEAAVGTDLPKLDSLGLEKLMDLDFCSGSQMVGSESGNNSMTPWTKPALCQQSRLVELGC